MIISLELEQCWDTASELREYLGKLERMFQRICEMEAGAPAGWYFTIKEDGGSFDIYLTHL